MFDNLSDRLQGIFSGLRGKGRLTEDDINSAMREVRMAMLEADVNFKVVKQFVARTKERCLDAEVLDSLTPTQNVIKIVARRAHRAARPHRYQAGALQPHPQRHHARGPAGLRQDHRGGQAGLPSEAGKPQPAARRLRRVPSRRSRSAAKRSATRSACACLPRRRQATRWPSPRAASRTPSTTCATWSSSTRRAACTLTSEMMEEAQAIKSAVKPDQILMVVDAMTGQDVVNVAAAFCRARRFRRRHHVEDGRRRPRRRRAFHPRGHGQAHQVHLRRARSPIRSRSSTPTAWPSRILGMGDVLSLIEIGGEGPAAGRGAGRDRTSHERPAHAQRLRHHEPARSARWAASPSSSAPFPAATRP